MRMKPIFWLGPGLGLILTLSLSIVAATKAASVTTPTADMYTNINAPSAAGDQTDPNNLWISLSGDSAGNCVATRVTYLKFSLTGLAPGETVDPALKLTLTRSGATQNSANYTVGLYRVANDWDESYQWNRAPLPGVQIGSAQPLPDANGAQMNFAGSELVSYVQLHADSDDVVSFAIQLVSAGVCPTGVVSAVFDAREDTGGSAPILTVKSPPESTSSPTQSVTPGPSPSSTPSGTPGTRTYYLRLPLILRSH